MAQAKATIDHDTIKRWVKDRKGHPAQVKGTGTKEDPGILRIDYPGYSGKRTLEKIPWTTFFEAFEANELAFLYQEEDDSRFSKFISRAQADLEEGAGGDGSKKAKATGKKKRGAEEEAVDAIEMLEEQHREVEDLFDEIESAGSARKKRRVFIELANALAAHTKIEETLFYPTVFTDETEDQLRESIEEHLMAKRLLADLLDMEPTDPQFMSKMNVLREVLEHHIEEEEQTLFEQVRAQNTEDMHVLGKQMQQRYKQLMAGEPKDELPEQARHQPVPF